MLTQAGHEVFTPTLTGVGERSHLLKPDVNPDTHILDVVNEMRWQELNNVVLVGHSYAWHGSHWRRRESGKIDSDYCVAGCFLSRDGRISRRFAAPAASGQLAGSGAQWRFGYAATPSGDVQRQ